MLFLLNSQVTHPGHFGPRPTSIKGRRESKSWLTHLTSLLSSDQSATYSSQYSQILCFLQLYRFRVIPWRSLPVSAVPFVLFLSNSQVTHPGHFGPGPTSMLAPSSVGFSDRGRWYITSLLILLPLLLWFKPFILNILVRWKRLSNRSLKKM